MVQKHRWLALVAGAAWLQGCEFSDLGQPPAQFTQPQAFQAYFKPVKLSDTAVLHDLMVRNRNDGTERAVDRFNILGATPPPISATGTQSYDRTPGRLRVLTYGTFAARGVSLGTATGLSAAQVRGLLYVRIPDGGFLSIGGPLMRLSLDDVDTPVRQITNEIGFCSIRPPTYDFANIEGSLLMGGHRIPDGRCGSTETLRTFRLGADNTVPAGELGTSFIPAGISQDERGTPTALLGFRFLREDTPGRTEDIHENLLSCPFDLQNVDADCSVVRGISPSRGELVGVSQPQEIRAQLGPAYRLQNRFTRVGRRRGALQLPDALFLFRGEREFPTNFALVHEFGTNIRPLAGETGDSFNEFNTILERSSALIERDVGPDLYYFADGERLYRVNVDAALLNTSAPELIYQAPPPADPATTLQRIREVRVVGDHVVFVLIRGPSDPLLNLGFPSERLLQALPLDAPTGQRVEPALLDRIDQNGVFRFRVLTSRSWTYVRERGAQSQARIIVSESSSGPDAIRSLCVSGMNPCDETAFDGSKWLRGTQFGTSGANVGQAGSLLTVRLGANAQADQNVPSSYVVYLRTDPDLETNPGRDTELYGIDLARPTVTQRQDSGRLGRLLGTLPGHTDPLDEVGCGGLLPEGEGTRLAGADFGEISGYGERALVEVRVERFARGDNRVRFDTDIYAVDFGAVAPSLQTISATPTLPLRDPDGRCQEPGVFLIPLNDDLVADIPDLAADRL